MSFGLADPSGSVRCAVFYPSKLRLCKEGDGVLINHSIWKGEIQVNQNSKVHLTSPPEVAQNIMEEARHIVHPREPPVEPISTAKQSPKGKTTTVRGKVISVSIHICYSLKVWKDLFSRHMEAPGQSDSIQKFSEI